MKATNCTDSFIGDVYLSSKKNIGDINVNINKAVCRMIFICSCSKQTFMIITTLIHAFVR